MQSEIASILRLNGWAGRVVLIAYGLGTTVVAVLNLPGLIVPELGVVALALLWAGLAILGLSQGEPLGLGWTLGVIGITTTVTAISSWNVVNPADPGYATWPLGAMTILLFVLALRGRRGLAWIGFLALAAVSIAVALVGGQDVMRVVNDILRQSATLVIGTLFAIVLRRATQSISSIQNSQVSQAAVAAAGATAARERDEQNSRLEQDARPALERIISTEPFSDDDLRAFNALAATLRGGIQATGSTGTRIADAVRSARVRGLAVTFIDEGGTPLSAEDRGRVETALLPLLTDIPQGSVTVRLSPDGSDEIATIVVEEGGIYRRILVTGAVEARLTQ